jgi:hypothetical protein
MIDDHQRTQASVADLDEVIMLQPTLMLAPETVGAVFEIERRLEVAADVAASTAWFSTAAMV